jgi:hypothetical protein
MSNKGKPGTGSTPGIESQQASADRGRPSQVPRDPDGPNPQAYDQSPEAEALRPRPHDGAGDPRAGAGDLHEASTDPDAGTGGG